MHGLHCARIEYYALSSGTSAKSCVGCPPSCWRSFEAQRVMLDASTLKRVVYFHISRVPRLTFFLSRTRARVSGGPCIAAVPVMFLGSNRTKKIFLHTGRNRVS